MSGKISVMISIPTKESIHAETVEWLLKQVQDTSKLRYSVGVHIIFSHYIPMLEVQRNTQVWDFLDNSEYTHLFLLDSDCVPAEGTIEKLLDYDLDIVASAAPIMIAGSPYLTILVPNTDKEYPEHKFRMLEVNNVDAHGLQKVESVGATGVLIKRKVLKTMDYPWFKAVYNDRGECETAEDYFFCIKAKEAGFEVWADFDLRQKHYKKMAL